MDGRRERTCIGSMGGEQSYGKLSLYVVEDADARLPCITSRVFTQKGTGTGSGTLDCVLL